MLLHHGGQEVFEILVHIGHALGPLQDGGGRGEDCFGRRLAVDMVAPRFTGDQAWWSSVHGRGLDLSPDLLNGGPVPEASTAECSTSPGGGRSEGGHHWRSTNSMFFTPGSSPPALVQCLGTFSTTYCTPRVRGGDRARRGLCGRSGRMPGNCNPHW